MTLALLSCKALAKREQFALVVQLLVSDVIFLWSLVKRPLFSQSVFEPGPAQCALAC